MYVPGPTLPRILWRSSDCFSAYCSVRGSRLLNSNAKQRARWRPWRRLDWSGTYIIPEIIFSYSSHQGTPLRSRAMESIFGSFWCLAMTLGGQKETQSHREVDVLRVIRNIFG
ncbi:hypothetical protein L218DRAFT_375277 [Marasmius fiardii PR-910]|nr:hypothetical protein L218DRAFT_375277 [Marasmius fiardii PR-910]